MLADDEYEVRFAALLFCRELLQQARPASMRVKHKRWRVRTHARTPMSSFKRTRACARVDVYTEGAHCFQRARSLERRAVVFALGSPDAL
eukprot:5086758-Pleurochrysis_carterae.AAC.1